MVTTRALSASVLVFCLAVSASASTFSKCDVQHLGATGAADVQAMINEALGSQSPTDDLNSDGVVNVLDVYLDIDAALGFACIADPGILSILPNTAQQGASAVAVVIAGRNTNFSSGSSIDLGSGITVSNIAASNVTTLTATLAVDSAATVGPRTLTVDGLTLANAFTVTVPVSVSFTYDTQGRLSTAVYNLPSGATTTVTYSYDSAGNRTAVVAQ